MRLEKMLWMILKRVVKCGSDCDCFFRIAEQIRRGRWAILVMKSSCDLIRVFRRLQQLRLEILLAIMMITILFVSFNMKIELSLCIIYFEWCVRSILYDTSRTIYHVWYWYYVDFSLNKQLFEDYLHLQITTDDKLVIWFF